ncbi:MAG: hypothetical protein MJ101_00585 [Clostridia bacterium]|nr:hypothetical protein [Clostridia bacterium]
MRSVRCKLCDRGGETLIEILCAILVVALATACFASCIATTVVVRKGTADKNAAVVSAYSAAEIRLGARTSPDEAGGTVTITCDGESVTIDVIFSSGSDAGLRSYYLR